MTDVAPLVAAVRAGRVYAVERWIADGKPIQFEPPGDPRKRPLSPLCAAIDSGQYDLVLLLLCNGYDPALEEVCPFSAALNARRHDFVDLLLAWGAEPSSGCTKQLVSCYDSKTIEKLWRCGLDLNERKVLAGAVASSTRNLPLYGFVKRHVREDPRLQRGLDIGLCRAVDRGNEKAVNLCIWAGADPWAQVNYVWYVEPVEDEMDEDEPWCVYRCAAGHAVFHRRPGLLRLMKVRGDAPHFQALYTAIWGAEEFNVLYNIAPPSDPSGVAQRALGKDKALLRRVFELGGRITEVGDYAAKNLRDQLRREGRYGVRELVELLQDPANVDEAVFLKIIHSPKVIDRSQELGITMQTLEKLAALPKTSPGVRAAARRLLRKSQRSQRRLEYEARRAAVRAASGQTPGRSCS